MSESKRNRREFFRVDDNLPLDYELISREELSKYLQLPLAVNDLSHCEIDGKDVPPGLLELLKSIELKLNYIIQCLTGEGYDPEHVPPIREVNISAGGLRFICKERFKKGSILRIRIGFPPHPYRVVTILGEVVRIEKGVQEGLPCYQTALKFLEVSEDLREDIIKYLLDIQRRNLKEKKISL